MKTYEKPMVIGTEELAEGVYMASGEHCYTTTAYIHQRPETGRNSYVIQLKATHAAADNHHSDEQTAILTFNQPVKYLQSDGTLVSGDGTTVLTIRYNYHNNGMDNIGLGDVYVQTFGDMPLVDPLFELQCNGFDHQH